MLIVLIRTCILYFLVVLALRLMGKRQIGELQPHELVITIIISDLATLPMQDIRMPLLQGIVPILTLLLVETLVAEISLKSNFVKNIFDGVPSVLIYQGKINKKALKNQKLSVDDLLEEIRNNGIIDLADVAFAFLESNGKVSVIEKEKNCKPTDMDIPLILMLNGKANKKTLDRIHKDETWLFNEINNKGYPIENVFLAMLDSSGKLYIQDKFEMEEWVE